MYYYQLYGYIIGCQMEIAQLVPAKKEESCDLEIIFEQVPEKIKQEIVQFGAGEPVHAGKDYMWLKNKYAIFAVYKQGKIYVENISNSDSLFLLQFVLGYGMSMYAYLQNQIAIHCGCVAIEGKGIVIAGASGAGKSTITMDLLESGADMISDDMVIAGKTDKGIYLYPAFPQQKLCRDTAQKWGYALEDLVHIDPEKDKFAISRRDKFVIEPQKLDFIFILEWYDSSLEEWREYKNQVITEEIQGINKIKVLVSNLFTQNMLPYIGMSAEVFQLCADIAGNVPIIRIQRPYCGETIEEVKKIIYQKTKYDCIK